MHSIEKILEKVDTVYIEVLGGIMKGIDIENKTFVELLDTLYDAHLHLKELYKEKTKLEIRILGNKSAIDKLHTEIELRSIQRRRIKEGV